MNWTLYFAEFPLIGSIIHVSTRVSISLFMVVLVYTPVLVGFILFFHFSMRHTDEFSSSLMSSRILINAIGMVSGELEASEFVVQHNGKRKENNSNNLI